MPNKYECIDTQCPFYKWEYVNSIVCDGVKHTVNLQIVTSNQVRKIWYRKRFCETKYDECPVYRMIKEKYEEDGYDG